MKRLLIPDLKFLTAGARLSQPQQQTSHGLRPRSRFWTATVLWRLSGSALVFALLLATFAVLPARAQDTNVFVPDGGYMVDGAAEAMRYMVSNALAQYGEIVSTNAFGTNDTEQADSGSNTNEVVDTNATSNLPAQDRSVHKESRSAWLDRQRAQQASAVASAQARMGSASTETQKDDAPTRPDYSAFRLVNDRNIFDPNRVPHQVARRTRERSSRVESFSLVGVMSYDKGTFAFFDGTSSDYRKALKLSDSIAGYKVTSISPDAVSIAAGTNQVELRVGMQMRSEEGGPWMPSNQSQSYADSPSSNVSTSVASTSTTGASTTTASTAPASAGGQSDLERRMMERRAQE